MVRDAVRTRPCMYTVRREAAENAEKREIVDRRTYGHIRQSAHEWVCEQLRKTVRPGSARELATEGIAKAIVCANPGQALRKKEKARSA